MILWASTFFLLAAVMTIEKICGKYIIVLALGYCALKYPSTDLAICKKLIFHMKLFKIMDNKQGHFAIHNDVVNLHCLIS